MAVGSKDEIGMWMLAQRMTRNFCAGVCETTHNWKIIKLENEEYPKLMTRTNISDLGEDIGSNNGPMQPLAHISKDEDLNSDISLLCANVSD
ncbi:hypothetical protein H5410_050424 [Solanum commersonii]|uniref:Uncharacterized protein n=1 Tax=Solanum commersonii TaxID=4109 RepID=A0A9J5WX12_SOLCO|nr:hypothetical protein H5410_050424 [Solanum commersonii]